MCVCVVCVRARALASPGKGHSLCKGVQTWELLAFLYSCQWLA